MGRKTHSLSIRFEQAVRVAAIYAPDRVLGS
jgi:hypothetical protein